MSQHLNLRPLLPIEHVILAAWKGNKPYLFPEGWDKPSARDVTTSLEDMLNVPTGYVRMSHGRIIADPPRQIGD